MNLTIIIPVYNCESFLDANFRSLAGLYDADLDFEIIYVNDGSTDDSLATLNNIADNNECVKVINQENQGSSGARNTAIEIAQGEYIQFLDADDSIDIIQLLLLLEKAEHSKLDLLGYRLDYVDETFKQIGVRAKQSVIHDKILSGKQFLIAGYQPSSICVFLFKNKLLKEYNLRVYPKITHMDVEFMCRVMLVAKTVQFEDAVIYHYTQRLGSITKPMTQQKKNKLLADEVIVASLIKQNLSSSFSPELNETITKNYNNVVWNLLFRFLRITKVQASFIETCKIELIEHQLYPIKGEMSTPFQRVTLYFFNTPLYWSLVKIINQIRVKFS
jgi:glycosyltransferase involved in cell wall biosynthesis|tara:strand:+ start:1180 stop:2172 length:993 start_codon:yes stop_codon:yes gene_type:complete